MVRTLSWNCRRRGIEMSLLSPGIAILFERSEWFQPLFAGRDRRGIPYDRLLAAEEVELDLSPGTLGKTNDPVRMYLREMGTVPPSGDDLKCTIKWSRRHPLVYNLRTKKFDFGIHRDIVTHSRVSRNTHKKWRDRADFNRQPSISGRILSRSARWASPLGQARFLRLCA